jgi:hypothetical protein
MMDSRLGAAGLALVFVLRAHALGQEPRPPERPELPPTSARPFVPPAERHLPPPAQLSPTTRALLHTKMAQHRRDMTDLVMAVILIDYPESARLARSIAEEPRLARPLTKDATELNTTLPDRYFQLQDELHERAAHLAEVARARNGAELASAFGQLAETCVSCHRVYSMGRMPER